MENALKPRPPASHSPGELRRELRRARQALLEAEATLAQEQAAVNAFRMHCRLRLDQLVDALMVLQLEKQSILTHLELKRQAMDLGINLDDDFWETAASLADETHEEPVLLPTDTPRDKAAEKRLYRQLARRFHPDLSQTIVEQAYRTAMMAAVNTAYAAGNLQTLYELAGELDPEDVTALAAIDSAELRRLHRQIMDCRRLRRRAQQRLAALRQENTARLYYKAQTLDEGSEDWWTLVQRELEAVIARRRRDVSLLRAQLATLEQRERPASEV